MLRSDRVSAALVLVLVSVGLACARGDEPSTERTAAVEGPPTTGSGGQSEVQPVNDLPNPYERIEPWAQLPAGV